MTITARNAETMTRATQALTTLALIVDFRILIWHWCW